jgi:hypothetical protein
MIGRTDESSSYASDAPLAGRLKLPFAADQPPGGTSVPVAQNVGVTRQHWIADLSSHSLAPEMPATG